ncbi:MULTISPECIES: hypothetical protein [unclassified Aureimonas]|uniref:hypothetical protein n=1 Tax=unclassified Aureimonas TaxID=2615206 RepID=UPI0006F79886|nr:MULTISPECIES: hypothetical protein [unclassified Aureimonas]KQT64075.1 hypothetical protein ASG62_03410 [Aureimonas sp. Leaf427]KQT81267.1 hypothetical protein ASG54_00680 [Aureimonas sp. Leaf460]
MSEFQDSAILIWLPKDTRPQPDDWRSPTPGTPPDAARWANVGYAINYAVGMMADRAAENLEPWIRSATGHVYMPAAIRVMAETLAARRR